MKTKEELCKEIQRIDDLYYVAKCKYDHKRNELTEVLKPYKEKYEALSLSSQKIENELANWERNNHGEHCKKGINYICNECYTKFEQWEREQIADK